MPSSTSKPTSTPTKLVPALKTPTGSAGKRISDTLVSFFGGLTSSSSDDGVLDENGSVTVEFDRDESSFKKVVDEVKGEDASNVEDELAGGKQKKNNNKKKMVEDVSTSSDEEHAPKKKSGKKKKIAVDSDEEDGSRNTKSGKKEKEAEPSCRSHRQASARTKKSY